MGRNNRRDEQEAAVVWVEIDTRRFGMPVNRGLGNRQSMRRITAKQFRQPFAIAGRFGVRASIIRNRTACGI